MHVDLVGLGRRAYSPRAVGRRADGTTAAASGISPAGGASAHPIERLAGELRTLLPGSDINVVLWADEADIATGRHAHADVGRAAALSAPLADHLRRRWSVDRPDVVQADCWLSGLAALRAARPFDVPVVVARTSGAVHPWEELSLPSDDVELRLTLGADHLLGRDEADLARLSRPDGGAPVSYQPIGVDARPPAAGGQLREPGRLATVVHLGREEDAALLLDTVVARDGFREVLLLVPDRLVATAQLSSELAGAMARARQRGVETRLVSALSSERRLELLHTTSIFVHTPLDAPNDRAVVEAMAAGCLVIAGNNGRLAGLVHDGIDGLVVEAGSQRSLCSALAAGAHPAVVAQLGSRAASTAEVTYSWPSVALNARDVLKTVVEGRR